MTIHGKPHTSEMLVTGREVPLSEGFVPMFKDKERPTPEHICSPEGYWVLPDKTVHDVELERVALYERLGADALLLDILASERLGQDVTEKTERWMRLQSKVRTDLPYPKE